MCEAWFEARGLVVRVHCSAFKESTGEQCNVTSLQAHKGAEPLRRGADRCTAHGGVVEGEARISRGGLIAGQQQARNVVLERERSGRVSNHYACRELPWRPFDPDDMLDRYYTDATYQAHLAHTLQVRPD